MTDDMIIVDEAAEITPEMWYASFGSRKNIGYDPYNYYGCDVPVHTILGIDMAVNSVIHVGDMRMHNGKRWSWFHRHMINLFFGWTVENQI